MCVCVCIYIYICRRNAVIKIDYTFVLFIYGNTIYNNRNKLKQNTKFLLIITIMIHDIGKTVFLELSQLKQIAKMANDSTN